MKKIFSLILVLSILLSTLSVFSIVSFAAMPPSDALGGYENICLTYTFRYSRSDCGRHLTEDLMPYVAYLDEEGNIKDFFFDSYLFLPCMDYGPSGARMHVDTSDPTLAEDWIAYVDDTFYEGANVNALNEAYGNAKTALNDTESKAGVFFTILYPCRTATNFGELGGRKLNFSRTADRKYAIKWIIDEQIKLYNEAGYENLDLVGFYWLEEFIVEEADVELFQYAADYIHSMGMKFIWIPWYCSNGYNRWEELGFDVASMQPNMYWQSVADENRCESSASISNRYGMSMEMEVDHRVSTGEYYNRYLEYLEVGMTSGAMDSIKTYYQDGKTGVYYSACYSENPLLRSVYDLTYKYAKGTLTAEDIDYTYYEKFELPENVEWVSYGKSYTACESFVDGNGCEYQNVSGEELTDGVIGVSDLGTEWHAFHYSILDEDNRMSAIIDLGEIRDDLTHFIGHFSNYQMHAIGTPQDIRFYTSENGTDFTLIANPDLITLDNVSYVCYIASEALTARYVKISFTYQQGYPFVFCSEVLVGAGDSDPNSNSGINSPNTDNTTDTDTNTGTDTGANTDTVPDNNTDNSGSDNSNENTDVDNGNTENGINNEIVVSPPVEDKYVLGDVNDSGEVDMVDYILVKRYYFNTYTLNEDELKRADVHTDSSIGMIDYILIKRIYFGTYTV